MISLKDFLRRDVVDGPPTYLFGVATIIVAGALCLPAAAQADFGFATAEFAATEAPTALQEEAGEAGVADTRAGSHPWALTAAFTFDTNSEGLPDQDVKDVLVELPPGLVGNPTAVGHCTLEQFQTQFPEPHLPGTNYGLSAASCAPETQLGYTNVRLNPEGTLGNRWVDTYNLVVPPGSPAEFGANPVKIPVLIRPTLRTGEDYGLSAGASNISQFERIGGSTLTFWGVPGDPSHDALRGECLSGLGPRPHTVQEFEHQCAVGVAPKPFLTLPTNCSETPPAATFLADSWQNPGRLGPDGTPDLSDPAWVRKVVPLPRLQGCGRLAFNPTVTARPTAASADSPTGLSVAIHDPQDGLLNPTGLAGADVRDVTVALPAGLRVDPSAANGLAACSEDQVGYLGSDLGTPGRLHFTPAAARCPDSSELGTVEIDTPLLEKPLPGAVYLAAQGDNPFHSLLALYIAVDDPQTGIVVKLAGKVEPDPVTGRLTASFDENPQLPFEDLRVDFFAGPRAPLTTPPTCGTYTTTTDLTPWSSPEGSDATPSDSFQISSGAGGAACASDEPGLPNHPVYEAGTLTPLAATYSPFVMKLSREDGSQQFGAIDATLPPGLTGKLAGIPYCPASGIAQAEGRTGLGQGALEQSSPSCPAASEVGTVTVGAGSGTPVYVTGHAYLAGPYKGAPLSLAIITPAVAGPFDLGDVVVRTALFVDETTAQIHAVSDPLPQILHGIPLDLRSVALDMSRPQFTLNPTSCDPMSLLGTSISSLGQAASFTQRFQVGGCKGLAFKPKLQISLKGQTKRSGHPALKAVLTFPSGQNANVARAQVSLPGSEFLDQGNLDKVCTRPELAAHNCPKSSIYGKAKAFTPLLEKPLEGNVYLGVGFGYKLPALVAELDGQIRVLLKGKVDTDKAHGIRNTFEAVPDAPVERFVLEMKGGKKYGLLENSEDICAKPQKAEASFTGQNGAVDSYKTTIQNSCGKKIRSTPRATGAGGPTDDHSRHGVPSI